MNHRVTADDFEDRDAFPTWRDAGMPGWREHCDDSKELETFSPAVEASTAVLLREIEERNRRASEEFLRRGAG